MISPRSFAILTLLFVLLISTACTNSPATIPTATPTPTTVSAALTTPTRPKHPHPRHRHSNGHSACPHPRRR